MDEIKGAMDDFEVNLCVEGDCDLCDWRICELEDSSPERNGNTVEIRLFRDFDKPEHVSMMLNNASRKVALRDVVALLRAAAMRMEYAMLERMPEDEIAKRFHDTLYGVIEAAYAKPEDAEVILDCLNHMLASQEDEVDGK